MVGTSTGTTGAAYRKRPNRMSGTMNAVIGGRHNIEYDNSVPLVRGWKDAFEQLDLEIYLGIKPGAKHKSIKSIVAPQIERIQASTDKVRRLAADKSRNPIQKHLVAEALANELTADLQRTHHSVAKIADGLVDDGEAEVRNVLGPRTEYAYLRGRRPVDKDVVASRVQHARLQLARRTHRQSCTRLNPVRLGVDCG